MKIGFDIVGSHPLQCSVARELGFDFQACNIMSDDITSILINDVLPDLTLDTLILNDASDARFKLGIISPCLDLESLDPIVRRNSEILFMKQVDWMLHCGVSVLATYLPVGECINFSRVLNRSASKLGKSIVFFNYAEYRW